MSRSSRKQRHREAAAKPEGWRRDVHADSRYIAACALAESGELLAAQKAFENLLLELRRNSDQAVVENNLGSLSAAAGDVATARRRFETALSLDSEHSSARDNMAMIDAAAAERNSHEFRYNKLPEKASRVGQAFCADPPAVRVASPADARVLEGGSTSGVSAPKGLDTPDTN